GEQHAEYEPAADDDLLDVGDGEGGLREWPEETRRHAGAGAAGECDEERALSWPVHSCSQRYRPRRAARASGPPCEARRDPGRRRLASPSSCQRYRAARAASEVAASRSGPARAVSIIRWDDLGSCRPVRRPSTACTPRSGVTTWSVHPAEARTRPEPSTDVSRARTEVVPTAITRPPRERTCSTSAAVGPGTSYRSAYGGSCASGDATPVCSVIGAMWTPRETRRVTRSGVKGRAALGISALPAARSWAKTVWYAAAGQSRRT